MTLIGVLLIIMAVFLVIAVLMQSSKDHRHGGTVAGGAETFFGKNKGKSLDAMFNKLTTVIAIIFVLLVIILYVIQSPAKVTTSDTGAPNGEETVTDPEGETDTNPDDETATNPDDETATNPDDETAVNTDDETATNTDDETSVNTDDETSVSTDDKTAEVEAENADTAETAENDEIVEDNVEEQVEG